MEDVWSNAVISRIHLAIYVMPNTGKHVHKDRPFHGIVINDADSVKDYIFSNGVTLKTVENSMFYLPKGSSYYVISHSAGGCYCINFDCDVSDEPFLINLRNTDELIQSFRSAASARKRSAPYANAVAMKALYDSFVRIIRERGAPYLSSDKKSIITPAIDAINRDFNDNALSVSGLAAACGISEVYFRRLFSNRFGVSPKEYIIGKRIEYAKQLLWSGEHEVSEVAVLCGYLEPCHFSREFKRRVGVAPNEFSPAGHRGESLSPGTV